MMQQRKLLCFIALVLSVMAVGCVTTGTKTSSSRYHPFYTPAKHISDLVKEGKFNEASEVYEQQMDYFIKKGEKHKDLLQTLATGLNEKLSVGINSISNEVEALHWPVPFTEWISVSRLIEEANDVLSDYESHTIFKHTDSKLPSVESLRSKLNSLKNSILNDAAKIFANYPLSSSSDFFSAYPVSVSAEEFLKTNTGVLIERCENATAQEIKAIFEIYKMYLPGDIREKVGISHYYAVLRECSKESKPGFSEILYAL